MSVYKGENVIAGGSVDTYFVRKPAWSQAVAVSQSDFSPNGYTIPADGIIFGAFYCSTAVKWANVTINDIKAGSAYSNPQTVGQGAGGTLSSIVTAGDVVKIDSYVTAFNGTFVPFEDSIVTEPEVVTPELIRNLHDPDWSQAEAITAAQLTAGWTATKRGIIVGWFRTSIDSSTVIVMKMNNVVVARGYQYNANSYWDGNAQCPVAAGDVIKIEGRTAAQLTLEIHFVPYKAQ